MGIVYDFFTKIKALVSKKDVEFTISNARDILDELKPLYQQYADFFSDHKPKDPDIKYVVESFYKAYEGKTGSHRNIFEDIVIGMENIEKNLEVVGDYIEHQFTDNSVGTALSLKKGVCVAFINNVEYCLDFMQTLADYYVDKEAMASLAEQEGNSSLTSAKNELIEKDIKRFAGLFSEVAKAKDKFEKDFAKLVDVQVTKDNEMLMVSENKSGINIQRTMGFHHSPVFFIAKLMANYTVDKYKERKEKIKYLQLRLMQLEAESKGSGDPALEKEIELLRNRIEKLESMNHDVERDLETGAR